MTVTLNLTTGVKMVLILTGLLLGSVSTGCNGEEFVTGMPTVRTRTPAESVERRPLPSERQRADEQFVTEGIARRRYPEGARDPMSRPYPSELGEGLEEFRLPAALPEVYLYRGPLADYSIDQLRLVGIISRTAEPVAIFDIPETNRNVFATLDMLVGPNGQGRITDIEPNRVIVSYEDLMIPGQPVQTREIILHGIPDEFDTVEFAPY